MNWETHKTALIGLFLTALVVALSWLVGLGLEWLTYNYATFAKWTMYGWLAALIYFFAYHIADVWNRD